MGEEMACTDERKGRDPTAQKSALLQSMDFEPIVFCFQGSVASGFPRFLFLLCFILFGVCLPKVQAFDFKSVFAIRAPNGKYMTSVYRNSHLVLTATQDNFWSSSELFKYDACSFELYNTFERGLFHLQDTPENCNNKPCAIERFDGIGNDPMDILLRGRSNYAVDFQCEKDETEIIPNMSVEITNDIRQNNINPTTRNIAKCAIYFLDLKKYKQGFYSSSPPYMQFLYSSQEIVASSECKGDSLFTLVSVSEPTQLGNNLRNNFPTYNWDTKKYNLPLDTPPLYKVAKSIMATWADDAVISPTRLEYVTETQRRLNMKMDLRKVMTNEAYLFLLKHNADFNATSYLEDVLYEQIRIRNVNSPIGDKFAITMNIPFRNTEYGQAFVVHCDEFFAKKIESYITVKYLYGYVKLFDFEMQELTMNTYSGSRVPDKGVVGTLKGDHLEPFKTDAHPDLTMDWHKTLMINYDLTKREKQTLKVPTPLYATEVYIIGDGIIPGFRHLPGLENAYVENGFRIVDWDDDPVIVMNRTFVGAHENNLFGTYVAQTVADIAPQSSIVPIRTSGKRITAAELLKCVEVAIELAYLRDRRGVILFTGKAAEDYSTSAGIHNDFYNYVTEMLSYAMIPMVHGVVITDATDYQPQMREGILHVFPVNYELKPEYPILKKGNGAKDLVILAPGATLMPLTFTDAKTPAEESEILKETVVSTHPGIAAANVAGTLLNLLASPMSTDPFYRLQDIYNLVMVTAYRKDLNSYARVFHPSELCTKEAITKSKKVTFDFHSETGQYQCSDPMSKQTLGHVVDSEVKVPTYPNGDLSKSGGLHFGASASPRT